MAADANSIPFLSTHAFRSYRFRIISPHGEAINSPNAVIQVSTYNLQNKCFIGSFATGMAEVRYQRSKPLPGQILYTTASQTITYKYKDAAGEIKEKSVQKSMANLSGKPAVINYENALLAQVRTEEANFQPMRLSNHPFQVNESVAAYETRKEQQIAQIMGAIDAGDDIINLQEIDFLKLNDSTEPGLDQAKQRLQKRFFDCLELKGYHRAIMIDASDQPFLAVIYNASKFKLMDTRAVFQYTGNEGPNLFRGMETIFQLENQSSLVHTIVNTNLHLQYGHDYQDEIASYQSQFERREGMMHVMAGDCGNCQNLPTALGSKNECTSLGKDSQGGITLNPKSQDVAFVVAPKGYKVESIVNRDRSQQFTLSPSGGIHLIASIEAQSSCTEVGERGYGVRFVPRQSTLGVEDDFVDLGNSQSSQPRGQVYFIRAIKRPFTLTTEIYNQLLVSPTGTYQNFELIDAKGHTVQSENKSIANTVFVYPGNETQALEKPAEKNPNAWRFNDVTVPQYGGKLAQIAQELTTRGKGGCAFPLLTTFYTFALDSAGLARRAELAMQQMQRLNDLLDQGLNVAIYVKSEKGIAFTAQQFVCESGGTKYYLAFWGGVNKQVEQGDSQLAAIYADGVKRAAENQPKNQRLLISCHRLWAYLCEREGSLNPFSLFRLSKFPEGEKVSAAAKLIVAIIHYNFYGSMANFQGERLNTREQDGLGEGELKKAVDEALKEDGVRNAILTSIAPMPSLSITH